MSISEQIHYLRSLAADQTPEALYEVFDALNEAADTIESLSAKLAVANEELKRCREAFDCNGEWIYCGDKDDFPNESGEYRAIFNGTDIFGNLNFDSSDNTWYEDNGQYRDVIAWWKEYPHES